MNTPTMRFLPALLAAFLFLPAGCSSAPESVGDRADEVEDWIDNPGNIRDVLAVVGSAPILGNESAARMRAEANGRGQMAATLQAQVQSMMSNWFKETGDMLNADSVSSYINDEGLTRQITDVEIGGARAVKYKQRGNVQYVLLVLEDPSKFVQNVGDSVKSRALKDDTLLKTEVLKRDFEDKMDKLINADSKKVEDQTKEFLDRYTGDTSAVK
jgi:hypothetical protein